MSTPSRETVAKACEAMRTLLAKYGPGQVVTYTTLVRDLEPMLDTDVTYKRRYVLARAALEHLRKAGQLQPWGRQTRNGKWVVTHVRLPGKGPVEPTPPARKELARPDRKREGGFHVAPTLKAAVEAIILDLLQPPHDPRELLLASAFAPPPARGLIPYAWLTPRVGHRIELSPPTRLNVIGACTRALARKGQVELIAPRIKNGKHRIRWVRLVQNQG